MAAQGERGDHRLIGVCAAVAVVLAFAAGVLLAIGLSAGSRPPAGPAGTQASAAAPPAAVGTAPAAGTAPPGLAQGAAPSPPAPAAAAATPAAAPQGGAAQGGGTAAAAMPPAAGDSAAPAPSAASPPAPAAASSPAPSPAAPSPAPAAGAGGAAPARRLTLQLGSFLSETAARQLIAELQRQGIAARLVSSTDDSDRAWHAVRVGAFPDRAAAERAARALERRHNLTSLIVAATGDS